MTACDPLARSTRGFFTCKAQNCNPCTRSSHGFFVFGEEDKETESGYDPGEAIRADKFLREHYKLLRERINKEIFGDAEIEEELDPIELPIGLGATALNEIEDPVDREIARLLRKVNIQNHAKQVKERLGEDMAFEEELMLMMVLLDE